MKFGELTALINKNDRFVRVYVDGDRDAITTINKDGILGSFLKDFEIIEISVSYEKILFKLKGAGE